ncbi:Methyltransferase type 11 domain-containing protein [Gammaproteobacteria bacterium]
MKYRLIDLLRCPSCQDRLALTAYVLGRAPAEPPIFETVRCSEICTLAGTTATAADPVQCRECYRQEVEEGRLACSGCGAAYPIVAGVPRLLQGRLLEEALAAHPQFIARHGGDFPRLSAEPRAGEGAKVATLRAFGYQWTTFVDNFDYFRELFLSFVHPFLGPEDFRGRLVLEVGCGSGRPASVAASLGAEVVGCDLSAAVETAHTLRERFPLIHAVQADAYALPLRPAFDIVYSVGVIQHLPDPARALIQIARLVQPGRPLVVWVYGVREVWYRPIDGLRRITVRLPFSVLRVLSYGLAVWSEIFLLTPYRILNRLPATRRFAQQIPGRVYAMLPFRENVLGWFDRLGAPVTHYFSREQVTTMLEAAGLRDVEVVARPGASASWVARGMRLNVEGESTDCQSGNAVY